jgi:predicted TIM-barrel fold metal-dependent hydrolase
MLESLTGLSGCMVSPNVLYHMRYHGETDTFNFLSVSTALECFGTHRLVFGSTNPATLIEANRAFEIVAPGEWYTSIARQVIAELVAGEGIQAATASMDAVFAKNALSIFTAK